MQDYQGYLELISTSEVTVDGAKDIYGSILPMSENEKSDKYENNTLGIRIIENNITNDVDEIVNPADGQSIVNMLIPKTLKTEAGKGNMKSIKALDYHKEIEKYFNKELGVDLPKEEFSFSIAGLKIKEAGLGSYMLPEKGLQSMNISYGENGITTSFVFSTRSAVMPSPAIFLKSLGPKLNTYGR